MISCIYKIYCKDSNIKDFYIGKAKDLNNRIATHRHWSKKNSKQKLYKFINENGGIENFDFEIIQELTERNLNIINDIEREYICIYKPTLNSNKLKIETKDKAEYKKKYAELHRDQIKNQPSHQYVICSCGDRIQKRNLKLHQSKPLHERRLNKKMCIPVN